MSMHALLKDSSLSAIVAGLSATLIGYAGPFAIIFQAARSGGLETEILASWVWAVSIGSGVLCIVLSLYWRVPVRAWLGLAGIAIAAYYYRASCRCLHCDRRNDDGARAFRLV